MQRLTVWILIPVYPEADSLNTNHEANILNTNPEADSLDTNAQRVTLVSGD